MKIWIWSILSGVAYGFIVGFINEIFGINSAIGFLACAAGIVAYRVMKLEEKK